MTPLDAVILALYALAALLPIAALARNIRAHKKITSERAGYDLSDYYHSPEGIADERASRMRELLLVGGGVVLASVAGALSLIP